ncbi:FliH/SctL family protein [Gymnodinialimonas sp.]
MTRSLILKDFASPYTTQSLHSMEAEVPPADQLQDETDALESYDAGYKCGWADCAAAEVDERTAIGADLAKNLSEAQLTYETARRDVIAALGPFFADVAATLLPKIASAALAPTVLAELGALAEDQTEAEIEIRAAPSACAALERLGETEQLSGLTVRPEPAFAEGQVSIRVGSEQRDLDMASAANRIADAVADFAAQSSQFDAQTPSKGVA